MGAIVTSVSHGLVSVMVRALKIFFMEPLTASVDLARAR